MSKREAKFKWIAEVMVRSNDSYMGGDWYDAGTLKFKTRNRAVNFVRRSRFSLDKDRCRIFLKGDNSV